AGAVNADNLQRRAPALAAPGIEEATDVALEIRHAPEGVRALGGQDAVDGEHDPLVGVGCPANLLAPDPVQEPLLLDFRLPQLPLALDLVFEPLQLPGPGFDDGLHAVLGRLVDLPVAEWTQYPVNIGSRLAGRKLRQYERIVVPAFLDADGHGAGRILAGLT